MAELTTKPARSLSEADLSRQHNFVKFSNYELNGSSRSPQRPSCTTPDLYESEELLNFELVDLVVRYTKQIQFVAQVKNSTNRLRSYFDIECSKLSAKLEIIIKRLVNPGRHLRGRSTGAARVVG